MADEKAKKAKTAKRKPIEKYYAYRANQAFYYDVVDPDNGKPLIKRDGNNQPMIGPTGQFIRITRRERFHTLENRMSKGFLSYIEFDPNTDDPQELVRGDALRELAKRPDQSKIVCEEVHEKTTNYKAYVERKRVNDLEDQLAAKDQKLAELEAKIKAAEGK